MTRRNKYNVSPKAERTVDGIVFDSKKEATRYGELKLLVRAGQITGLRRQPRFDIVVNGVKIGFYKGDFGYDENGKSVVEDVKGMKTPMYRLKKKLVEALYGFEITET